ncbi:MAG TPA: FtsX-like permease family protein, partial [Vicinamibacterales bacterium]|nr:FtsX-like permease family protein [Vicinamibacterales bacterium]
GLHRADDLWIPASTVVQPSLLANRQAHLFDVVGRLAPGVTLERARDELALISARLAAEYPESNRGWTPHVVSLSERVTGKTGPALLVLMVAVLFVLLIASANVANVLLARGTTRAPEFALRLALGANRQAIVRDVLAEASLLALLGGIVGVALAFVGMRALRAAAVGIVPRASEMTLDASALAVAVGASLLAIMIGGLPPAVFATRGTAANKLREAATGTGRGVARSRTQYGLIVAQTALGIVLLTGAALLLKALVRLRSTDLGFQPENVAAATFNLPRATYGGAPARSAFVMQLLTRLSALPGVRAAAVASAMPGGTPGRLYFGIPGRTFPAGSQPVSHLIAITPDYFKVLGIRVVGGRPFLPTDLENAVPVAVVDELFAQRYFPGENALGKRVLAGNDTIPREIVGIVRTILHAGPLGANEATIYVPYMQTGVFGDPNVLVRAESNVAAIAKQIHAQIRELGPGVPIYNEQTLDTRIAQSIGATRLFAWLAALFGACAVILACVGVYGVLAFSVAQRTREIGVRIALGAAPDRVVRDVVVGGLTVTAVGVAVGVGVALWVTRWLAALLNTVSPTDAPSFLLATVLFLVVAAVASLVPASRAGRVDPLVALRAD